MSSDLKAILDKVAEEEYRSKKLEIEEGLERFKSFLLKIAKTKKWSHIIWVEGSMVKKFEKYEKDLNLLEKGDLVKGRMKYTEHNAYRVYQLTPKGFELAKKLLEETQ
jgi:hypothetical protein